jgi:hypothetical protein
MIFIRRRSVAGNDFLSRVFIRDEPWEFSKRPTFDLNITDIKPLVPAHAGFNT